MKQKMTLVWSLMLVTVLAGCGFMARDRRAEQRFGEAEVGQPTYFVDYAGFKIPGQNKSRLEVYYQVYNFGLQFKKDSGRWAADYQFIVRVTDGGGTEVKTIDQNRRVTVDHVEATTSRFDYRTSEINLELKPGRYTIETTLKDLGSGRIKNKEFPLTLRNFDTKLPTASDILFTQAAEPKAGEPGVFDKGNVTVVPSVSRFYGGEDSTRLIYYLEVYPGSQQGHEKVNVETVVRSPIKGMLYRDTLYVDLKDPVVRQLRDISLAEYAPGDYDLIVTVRGRRNKELFFRDESFTIQWSQEALLKHDFNAAVEQLAYIASSSDIDPMKKLGTLEERIRAFNAFWDAHDPTPGTRENEMKREFYRRVTYANRQFRHLRRDGWRTDRGRIYIQFGEPDQIDDFPISPQYPPYQIWHYYREGRYRRFLFVDQNEDGDFRLQYPYDGLYQQPDF